ncbi:MARK2 isoform 15, partial [Pan troglodytes]
MEVAGSPFPFLQSAACLLTLGHIPAVGNILQHRRRGAGPTLGHLDSKPSSKSNMIRGRNSA